jgi:hypothetical protein
MVYSFTHAPPVASTFPGQYDRQRSFHPRAPGRFAVLTALFYPFKTARFQVILHSMRRCSPRAEAAYE